MHLSLNVIAPRGLFPMLLALIIVSSCSQREKEVPREREAREVAVSGQVFIVTQGALNVKLGLVEVRLISEADALKYLEGKKAEAQVKQANLDSLIAECKEHHRIAVAAATAAKRAEEIAEQELLSAEQEDREFIMSHDLSIYNWDSSKSDSAQKKYDALTNQADDKQRAIEKWIHENSVLSKRKAYFSSGQFYFAELPAGIASTKTDADGEFTLKAPIQGSFVLEATASRQVGGQTELYFWLVKLVPDSEANCRVLLSNDNMTTSSSPNSILKTTDYNDSEM